jgi:hypothetical protein
MYLANRTLRRGGHQPLLLVLGKAVARRRTSPMKTYMDDSKAYLLTSSDKNTAYRSMLDTYLKTRREARGVRGVPVKDLQASTR